MGGECACGGGERGRAGPKFVCLDPLFLFSYM